MANGMTQRGVDFAFFGVGQVTSGIKTGPYFVQVIEPPATNNLVWRGSSLASGMIRGTNGSSIFYSFIDDKNTNGQIDIDDDFITAEYLVTGTNASLLTESRQSIASLIVAQSYGLASVNFLNVSNEVLFTGEPDGQVFAWTARARRIRCSASCSARTTRARRGMRWRA